MGEGEFQDYELITEVYTGSESDPFFDPQDPQASEEYDLFVRDMDSNMRILCLLFPTSVRPMLDDQERVGIKLSRRLRGGEIDLVRDVWATQPIEGEYGEEYFITIEDQTFTMIGKKIERKKSYLLSLMCLGPKRETEMKISKLNLIMKLPKRGSMDLISEFFGPVSIISLSDGKRLSAIRTNPENSEVADVLARNFGFQDVSFDFYCPRRRKGKPWIAVQFPSQKE